MAGIRPPFVSQGKADDLYGIAGIGAGLTWLIGGMAAAPAAAIIAACGAGVALNHSRIGDKRHSLTYVPPTTPPDRPSLQPNDSLTASKCERDLEQEFGINAVYCYRTMLSEGKDAWQAFNTLRAMLREMIQRGLWSKDGVKGQPDETPQNRLARAFDEEREQHRRDLIDEGHDDFTANLVSNVGRAIKNIGIEPVSTSAPQEFEDEYAADSTDEGAAETPDQLLLPPSGQPIDIQNEARLISSIDDQRSRDAACYLYRKLRQQGNTPKYALDETMSAITDDQAKEQAKPKAVGKVFPPAGPPPTSDPNTAKGMMELGLWKLRKKNEGQPLFSAPLHRDATGRAVASPELMQLLDPQAIYEWFVADLTADQRNDLSLHRTGSGPALLRVSFITYILGAKPISEPHVCRLCFWPECDGGHYPIYYAMSDGYWYPGGGKLEQFESTWDEVLNHFLYDRPDLKSEAESLKDYRLEVYHDPDVPPGREPGSFSWWKVLFGGNGRCGPASEEDLRGKM